MTNDLDGFFQCYRPRIEQVLASRLDQYTDNIRQQQQAQSLNDALRYSTLASGKRIRAMLVYMAAQACGGLASDTDSKSANPMTIIDTAAAAVEMIHCYSLIHDDLPAMDDDDLRRGKPSCHIKFGEATAILAGDALQTMAFELLFNDAQATAELRVALSRELGRAAGANGMVGGQAIDLAVVNQSMSYQQLIDMHSLKTGALIDAAAHMGGLCANADGTQIQALRTYAQAIGLAFQVQDDILDIEGSSAQTGKPQGADIAANKPTYPAIMGLDEAKAEARNLCTAALAALSPFSQAADPLRALARYIIERPK